MEAPLEVVWTEEADRDRDSIIGYVWLYSPQAAAQLDARFDRAAEGLGRFPRSGKSGVIDGTRELLPHPHYRLIYSVSDDAVTILGIMHTARQWPPGEDGTS